MQALCLRKIIKKTHAIIGAACDVEDRLGTLMWCDRVSSPSNPSDPLFCDEFVGFDVKDRCYPKLEQVLQTALRQSGPG